MKYKKGPTTKERLYTLLGCVKRLGISIPPDIRKMIYQMIDELDYEVHWTKRIELRYIKPMVINNVDISIYMKYPNLMIDLSEIGDLLKVLPIDMEFGQHRMIDRCFEIQECPFGYHDICLCLHINGIEINKKRKTKKLLLKVKCCEECPWFIK